MRRITRAKRRRIIICNERAYHGDWMDTLPSSRFFKYMRFQKKDQRMRMA